MGQNRRERGTALKMRSEILYLYTRQSTSEQHKLLESWWAIRHSRQPRSYINRGHSQRLVSAPRYLLLHYCLYLCSTAEANSSESKKFLHESQCMATHQERRAAMNHRKLSYLSNRQMECCFSKNTGVLLSQSWKAEAPPLPVPCAHPSAGPAHCGWHRLGSNRELVPVPPLGATCSSFSGLDSALSFCLATPLHEICRNVHISKAFNFCMWFDSMSGEGKAGSHKCINSGNQHKHILPSFHWVAAFYSPMSHTLLRELRRCRNIQYLIIREAVESTERPTQGTLFMKQFKSKVIYTTLRIAFEACFQFQFYPTSISYLP